MFRNLIENALRYTGQGGTITIRIGLSAGDVRVEVTDTGAGISSRALPRIFERFYRADTSRARSEGGTGLGLAIVRHLIQAIGGTVGAESELGTGTTVWFALPGDLPEEELRAGVAATGPPGDACKRFSPGGRLVILLRPAVSRSLSGGIVRRENVARNHPFNV